VHPDIFIHGGWRGVAGKHRDAPFQVVDNLPCTIDSVALALKCGCRQWIGLGSQAEYGNPNQRIDESAATHPLTLYGKAKLAAGIAALGLCEASGIFGSWIRIFSLYGGGGYSAWVLPYAIRHFLDGTSPALTQCSQRWDFLHARDAAEAILAVAREGVPGVFNLGSGSAPPLRDTVEIVRNLIGPECPPANYGAIPYSENQVMHLEADIGKIQTSTSWNPRIPLREGLEQLLADLLSMHPPKK